jgi:hypothetical protein
MKHYVLLAAFIFFSQLARSQSVGVGTTTPDNSAQLDITSTTKGVLVPRMNSSQISLIPSPATGLMVYQTNGITGFYYNSGNPASPVWKRVGDTQYPTSPFNNQSYYIAGVQPFVVPAGVTAIYFEILSGGGGSGGTYLNGAASYGGGGGGGGCFASGYILTTPGETLTLTIGDKGTNGSDGNPTATDGAAGQTTSIANTGGILISCAGGAGGKGGAASLVGNGGSGGYVSAYNSGSVLKTSQTGFGGISGYSGNSIYYLKGDGGYAAKMGEYNTLGSFTTGTGSVGSYNSTVIKPIYGVGGGCANIARNGYVVLYW